MEGKISEKELFESVKPEQQHEAIYLCSAMVLEEYRRKGIAKKLAVEAIDSIRKEHDIQFLFVWAFSPEGMAASEELSRLTGLPLLKKLN
jgi:predicted GNAT family acetyltransferase